MLATVVANLTPLNVSEVVNGKVNPRLLRRRGATHSEQSVHKLRLAKVLAEQQHLDDHLIDRLNKYQLLVGTSSIIFWVIEFIVVVDATKDVQLGNVVCPVRPGFELVLIYPPAALVMEIIYSILTLLMVYMIYHYYRTCVTIENRRMQIEASDSIWRSQFRWMYIIETLAVFIQPIPFLARFPPPYVDPKAEFINTQVKVGLIMFLRLYPALRVLRDRSLLFRRRRDIAKMINVEPGFFSSVYIFKASFNKKPALITTIVTVMGIVVSSLSLYVAEWSVVSCSGDAPSLFQFQDAVYLTFITMTSVGYGDIAPKTHLGRAVMVCAAWFGVLVASLQVAAVERRLEMNIQERCSVAWVLSKTYNYKERLAATKILQVWWRNVLARAYGPHYLSKGILKMPGHEMLMKDPTASYPGITDCHSKTHQITRQLVNIKKTIFSDNAKSRKNFRYMRNMFLKKQRAILKFNEAMDSLHQSGIVSASTENKNSMHGHHEADGSCKPDPLTVFTRRLTKLEDHQELVVNALHGLLDNLRCMAPHAVDSYDFPPILVKPLKRRKSDSPYSQSLQSTLMSLGGPRKNPLNSQNSFSSNSLEAVHRAAAKSVRLQPISVTENDSVMDGVSMKLVSCNAHGADHSCNSSPPTNRKVSFAREQATINNSSSPATIHAMMSKPMREFALPPPASERVSLRQRQRLLPPPNSINNNNIHTTTTTTTTTNNNDGVSIAIA